MASSKSPAPSVPTAGTRLKRANRNTKTVSVLEDLDNHPLKHLVPDAVFATDYVHRKIGGVSDFDIFDAAFEGKENVLIEGPTGAAKTSAVYAWAASRGLPVVNIACNGAVEPRQLVGGWVPQPDGTFRFVPGDLALVCLYGGVAYWDEVNMMPGRVGAYAHGALDRRRQLTIMDATGSDFPTVLNLHDYCINIATYNEGYSDTYDLNEAFKNRYTHKLKWGYSPEVEKNLILTPRLRAFAETLRKRVADGSLRTPISTNLFIEFEGNATNKRLGLAYAVECFLAAFHNDERQSVQEMLNNEIGSITADMRENLEF